MSTAAPHVDRITPPIGPGRLVLVVGPSGAGKDSVLRMARIDCAGNPSIVFPRRAVTRPANADEDHECVDQAQFDTALREGVFALAWQAHGLCYGVPRTVDDDIRLGRTVVCNVSRGIIPSARTRYAQTACVLITAPKEILAARLCARARASDTSIATRMERNDIYSDMAADIVIDNFGSLDNAIHTFVSHLRRLTAT